MATREEKKIEKKTDIVVESDKYRKKMKRQRKQRSYDYQRETIRFIHKVHQMHEQLKNFEQLMQHQVSLEMNKNRLSSHWLKISDCKSTYSLFEIIDSINAYTVKMHFAYCDGEIFVNGVHRLELGDKMYESAGVLNSDTFIVDENEIPIPKDSEAVEILSEQIPKPKTKLSFMHSVFSKKNSREDREKENRVKEERKSLEYYRIGLEEREEKSMKSIQEILKLNDDNSPGCTISLGRFYHKFGNGYCSKYYVHVALCNNIIFINAEPHKDLGSHWDGEFGITHDGYILINKKKYIRAYLYHSMMTLG